ncbi:GNAT family N-acetyltransferase [Sulfuracidifex tepidarius]|uniref:N-acetyltransferase n=1 Tax=Sulfuracidifex tepidarius TaxID=1294262 RepID=A0A510DWQ9_9CREN|nr:GNAT family N-acetyltransferase [Sulfuracidifex tepidarius]BBG24629.1 putative N-acetyltransferase [Sulfuracidifex tepidarius]BBG27417.1 putative N-acetyltransferase [Sulfuracidifex tepidarius]
MVVILDATEGDLAKIYEIEVQSFDQPYSLKLLKAYLFLSEGLYIVAKEHDEILGYAIGLIQNRFKGHVISIATARGARRKGIGSALLQELNSRFVSMGSTYSYLEVEVKNRDAISFYSHNKYHISYTRRNYYGKNRHAFIMIKLLKGNYDLD